MSKTYLKVFFSLLLFGVLSIAAFNWLVDPFSLYSSPRIKGFNADKSEFLKYLRLTKPYAVLFGEPSAVILGTSRSGRGLSPQDAAWDDRDVYNLALPAGSMYENLRLLQHASATRQLSQVVIGLDFRLFNGRGINPAFSEGRMLTTHDGSPTPGFYWNVLSDFSASLVSASAFKASLDTVRLQDWNPIQLLEYGHWDRTQLAYNHRQAFKAYTQQSLERLSGISGPLSGLEDYREFLWVAHQQDIDLRLMISPSHVTHWILVEKLGLWPRFEQLKRELVRINLQVARETDREPFPLWDFSGVNHYSIEPIPIPGKPSKPMRWFWESVHYKTSLGSKVLDKILDKRQPPLDDADFGVLLFSSNLDGHLSAMRQQLLLLIAQNGPEVELVNEAIASRSLANGTIVPRQP